MFNRARRQLTILYATSGVALFIVLAAMIFITVIAVMDREIDADIAEVIEESTTLLLVDRSMDEAAVPVAFGPVFVFAFAVDGTLIANPRLLPVDEMFPPGAVHAAMESGEPSRAHRSVGDDRFRLHYHPVVIEGTVAGVVVAGRSLARRDAEVKVVATTLVGSVVVWAVLASTLAYVVAGRALRPVREAYLRQEAFVAGAAHELRSPIAVIRAASEVGLRGAPPPEVRALLVEISAVANEASTLVDTLLDLARLAPPAGADVPATDLAVVVGRELVRMQPLMESHRVRVVDDLASAVVQAPPESIGRITRAILENMIAHTPPGTAVVVRTRAAGAYGELSVEDNGPGLEATELGAMFDPFSRGDRARQRSGGSGMGLSIVHGVATHYGGWVRARPPAGGTGLVVEVGLPASGQQPAPLD